jgi:hypothetical protein
MEVDEKLCEHIDHICQTDSIILGDLNYPHIDWNTFSGDSCCTQFLDTCQNNFLSQHVTDPTRGEHTLDIILSTDANKVQNVTVNAPLGNSDHSSVDFYILWQSMPVDSNYHPTPNYWKGNYDKIRSEIRKVNWDDSLSSLSVDSAWTFFKDIMLKLVDEHIPKRYKASITSNPKWANNNVTAAAKRKKYAWKKYKLNKTEENSRTYKRTESNLKHIIKYTKAAFERQLATNIKSNSKPFFAYVNNKTIKSKVGPLQKDGRLITEELEMANELNSFFSSVFTLENTDDVPETSTIGTCVIAESISVTDENILKELSTLKENKAPGVDNMHPKLLRECANEIARPLCIIFNKSLNESKVPLDWKRANVTPIFKKGSKKDPGNYRPVSLTSVPCKILESIIKKQMTKFLEDNKLIKDSQHGFRSNRSCLTNLLEYLDYLTDKLDQKLPVDVIYLDFSKAFDKVPHLRLIRKVSSLGFGPAITNWIKDWLSNRTQRVTINSSRSTWTHVHSGVPQGSVLGPLLFLIYVNDMEKTVKSNLSKFADDTKLFKHVSSQEDTYTVQEDLNQLSEWARTWQMSFNTSKCKVLQFGKNNPQNQYHIGTDNLDIAHAEKDLGVHITDDLKPTKHIEEATSKANKVLGLIYRTIECKTREIILPLYMSLVRPHLEYCVQAWSPHCKKDIAKLEKVQKRAVAMIRGLNSNTYEDKLKELGLFSLEKRRLRGDLIETYKILNELDIVGKTSLFQFRISGTRGHKFKLYKQPSRTNVRKFFFSNRVIDRWNGLPSAVVESTSLSMFKMRLDKQLAADEIF